MVNDNKPSELKRFVTGEGRYTDDHPIEDDCFLVAIRSQKAHAHYQITNLDHISSMPGVLMVLDYEQMLNGEINDLDQESIATDIEKEETTWDSRIDELNALHLEHQEHLTLLKHMSEKKFANVFQRTCLPASKVTYVGQPIACVVADTLDQAYQAAQACKVDYQTIKAITTMEEAKQDKVLVHESLNTNCAAHVDTFRRKEVESWLKKSDHIFTLKVEEPRVIVNSLEPRCIRVYYDDEQNQYTINVSGQGVHAFKSQFMSVLRDKTATVEVITEDVGGGFGMKTVAITSENCMTIQAAKILRRPVRWFNSRKESFMSDSGGRDNAKTITIGLTKDLKFTGLKIINELDIGAFTPNGPLFPIRASNFVSQGFYHFKSAFSCNRAYYTNKPPIAAYRGAWRPESIHALERTIDYAARSLGVCPFELRLKNVIRQEDLNYQTYFCADIDSGDFKTLLEKAKKDSDWDGFESRRQASALQGKLRGRGVSGYLEIVFNKSIGQREGRIIIDQSGQVNIYIGSNSTGTQIETTLSHYMAAQLNCSVNQVKVDLSNSQSVSLGAVSGGSTTTAGSFTVISLVMEKLIDEAKIHLQNLKGWKQSDIEWKDGCLIHRGDELPLVKLPKILSLEVIEARATGQCDTDTYSSGAYVCEVEIDEQTGDLTLCSFYCVDDIGQVMNAKHVEGQLQGGVAMGIGQALMENSQYDSHGRALATDFWDYAIPKANDVCNISNAYSPTTTKSNPLSIKGVGEVGCVGAPGAIMNAAMDVLHSKETKHVTMPLTPEKIWRALQRMDNSD